MKRIILDDIFPTFKAFHLRVDIHKEFDFYEDRFIDKDISGYAKLRRDNSDDFLIWEIFENKGDYFVECVQRYLNMYFEGTTYVFQMFLIKTLQINVDNVEITFVCDKVDYIEEKKMSQIKVKKVRVKTLNDCTGCFFDGWKSKKGKQCFDYIESGKLPNCGEVGDDYEYIFKEVKE